GAARQVRYERPGEAELAAPAEEAVGDDLRPVLEEEVGRLPERYRTPFILCCLQGKTNADAAQQLGCPEGTVASRLSWARRRLRGRLTRRGVTLAAGGLAAGLAADAGASVGPRLVSGTVRAAVGFLTRDGLAGAGTSATV